MRPVATTLAMLAVLIAGILAYRMLPVSALPEVDYPTIQVVTLYPGASPEVMTALVTSPLERQFGQMPGLSQMSSSSSGGSSMITLQFDLGLPLDVAEQEVQAAINAGSNLLPSDLPTPPTYNKVNPADTPVISLAITSPTLPLYQVRDLIDIRVAQKLSQVSGVGLVSIAGGQRPADDLHRLHQPALSGVGRRAREGAGPAAHPLPADRRRPQLHPVGARPGGRRAAGDAIAAVFDRFHRFLPSHRFPRIPSLARRLSSEKA